LISRSDLAEEFEQVDVDLGNPILSDMLIDNSGQYIYCASPYKVCFNWILFLFITSIIIIL
jgi:hypothetical protein